MNLFDTLKQKADGGLFLFSSCCCRLPDTATRRHNATCGTGFQHHVGLQLHVETGSVHWHQFKVMGRGVNGPPAASHADANICLLESLSDIEGRDKQHLTGSSSLMIIKPGYSLVISDISGVFKVQFNLCSSSSRDSVSGCYSAAASVTCSAVMLNHKTQRTTSLYEVQGCSLFIIACCNDGNDSVKYTFAFGEGGGGAEPL